MRLCCRGPAAMQRSGRRARHPFRPSLGRPRPWSGQRPATEAACAALLVITPLAAKEQTMSLCRLRLGGTDNLARGRRRVSWSRASRPCGSGRVIGITERPSDPGPSSGCSIEWPRRASPSRPSTGSPTWPPTPRSSASWLSPSCAGGSSATTRSSSRSSASATSRAAARERLLTLAPAVMDRPPAAADGEASTTTPACASPPMAFSSASGWRFPPRTRRQSSSRHLPYPRPFGRAAPGQPRQRHVPTSIATWRHRLVVLLARQLDHCPCCGRWRSGP